MFLVGGLSLARTIPLKPLGLTFQWPRASRRSLGREDSYLRSRQPPVALPSPVSIRYPSREYFPVLLNCLSLHCSFAVTSGRSTFVDQPTIMLRNVSHPSAQTRIGCGTMKKKKIHISQKCHTRAVSKPPKSAASQWRCIGL